MDILDAAIIACHSYTPHNPVTHGVTFGPFPPKNSKIRQKNQKGVTWHTATELNLQVPPSNGFYAQLYYRFKNHKLIDAVIGIRGTVASKPGNDWEDLHSWISDVMATGEDDKVHSYLVKTLFGQTNIGFFINFNIESQFKTLPVNQNYYHTVLTSKQNRLYQTMSRKE